MIILGIVQVSFLTTWSRPVNSLNLILSLIIFLVAINRYRQGLWWAFGAGCFLELYSFDFSGLTTLALIITVVIVNFLFNNFFTNYSFYSLTISGLMGTLIYNLLIFLVDELFILLGIATQGIVSAALFFQNLIWQTVLNLMILYLIFFIFHFLIGKFKMDLSRQIPIE